METGNDRRGHAKRSMLLVAMTIAVSVMTNASGSEHWTQVGSLADKRAGHTLTALADGRVLAAGGGENLTGLDSSEVFDPSTQSWSRVGSLTLRRKYHTATLLSDSRVLVVGGHAGQTTAEFFDPETGSWSLTTSPGIKRSLHRATRLNDGTVLVSGGLGGVAESEFFDPDTEVWNRTLSDLCQGRAWHTSTLLADGRVLVTGGAVNALEPLAHCEIYDPDSRKWETTGSLEAARLWHQAILLPSGKVLVAGGATNPKDRSNTLIYLTDTEIYDPETGTWTAGPPMAQRRGELSLVPLPGSQVLAVGGSNGLIPLRTCEIFDESTLSWSGTRLLNQYRRAHGAALLGDGTVLVAGGLMENIRVSLNSTEILDPWDLGEPPGWKTHGQLEFGRVGLATAMLPDGRVLVVGGRQGTAEEELHCELYDPKTGRTAPTGSLADQVWVPQLHVLPGGTVLALSVVGSQLYDPDTETWSLADPMHRDRSQFQSISLPDGRVLAVGGRDGRCYEGDCEVFDPVSETWHLTGALNAVRAWHSLTLLSDGRVLAAGGFDDNGPLVICEVFDPFTEEWSVTGELHQARQRHSAATLRDGRVLVTGGWQAPFVQVAPCEIYDPETGIWSPAAPLRQRREGHTSLSLPDGRVVVTAGFQYDNDPQQLALTEIYDSTTNSWSPLGNMGAGRGGHDALLLPVFDPAASDFEVLIFGGALETRLHRTVEQLRIPATTLRFD